MTLELYPAEIDHDNTVGFITPGPRGGHPNLKPGFVGQIELRVIDSLRRLVDIDVGEKPSGKFTDKVPVLFSRSTPRVILQRI